MSRVLVAAVLRIYYLTFPLSNPLAPSRMKRQTFKTVVPMPLETLSGARSKDFPGGQERYLCLWYLIHSISDDHSWTLNRLCLDRVFI